MLVCPHPSPSPLTCPDLWRFPKWTSGMKRTGWDSRSVMVLNSVPSALLKGEVAPELPLFPNPETAWTQHLLPGNHSNGDKVCSFTALPNWKILIDSPTSTFLFIQTVEFKKFTFRPLSELLLLLVSKLPLGALRTAAGSQNRKHTVRLKTAEVKILQTYQMPCSSLSHLVTEDLDLSEGPVDWSAAAAVVAVGVDLDYQRHALHAFLWGEVCAQTVHRDEHLDEKKAEDPLWPKTWRKGWRLYSRLESILD